MLLPMTADQHTYFLRLESSLPASQYDHKPVEVSFVSDANFKNLSLSFAPMLRALDNELNQSTVMEFLMGGHRGVRGAQLQLPGAQAGPS